MTEQTWRKRFAKYQRTGGKVLEDLFLQAMERLKYKIVDNTNPRLARTIRRATAREELTRVTDYVITHRWKGQVKVIPLQLTMICSSEHPRLRRKRHLAEIGEIALFWPGSGLTSEQFFEIIEKAALGDKEALKDVKRGVVWAIEIFFKKRQEYKSVSR